MRIIGYCSYYNDELGLLETALRSLRRYSDMIVAVDGRYEDFPGEEVRSKEYVRELVDKLVDVNISLDTALPQWQKRNVCLREASIGDYFLRIDGDEELVGELDKNLLKERAYLVPIYLDGWHIPNEVVALFRMEKGLHYNGFHSTVFYGEECVNPNYLSKFAGLRLLHHRRCRTPERLYDAAEWKRRQIIKERPIREVYYL